MLGAREKALAERHPYIDWEEPVKVTVAEGLGGLQTSRLCCRFCIALNGLQAVEVADLGFSTHEKHAAHLKAAHEV
jgi:hypothetical protein